MLSSELRDIIFQFIESQISLNQLEDYLVPKLPFFLRFPDAPDADVIAAVELGMSEVSSGIRTVDQLRHDLRRVLQEYRAVSVSYPANQLNRTESGTTSYVEHSTHSIHGKGITVSLA